MIRIHLPHEFASIPEVRGYVTAVLAAALSAWCYVMS